MASSPSSLKVSLTLFAVYVLAKPLKAPPHPFSTVPKLLSASNLTFSQTLNTTSGVIAGLEIHCNGEHFGFHPIISDCESAKEHMAPDSTLLTWGERHSGLGPGVIPMPYRIMGGR